VCIGIERKWVQGSSDSTTEDRWLVRCSAESYLNNINKVTHLLRNNCDFRAQVLQPNLRNVHTISRMLESVERRRTMPITHRWLCFQNIQLFGEEPVWSTICRLQFVLQCLFSPLRELTWIFHEEHWEGQDDNAFQGLWIQWRPFQAIRDEVCFQKFHEQLLVPSTPNYYIGPLGIKVQGRISKRQIRILANLSLQSWGSSGEGGCEFHSTNEHE